MTGVFGLYMCIFYTYKMITLLFVQPLSTAMELSILDIGPIRISILYIGCTYLHTLHWAYIHVSPYFTLGVYTLYLHTLHWAYIHVYLPHWAYISLYFTLGIHISILYIGRTHQSGREIIKCSHGWFACWHSSQHVSTKPSPTMHMHAWWITWDVHVLSALVYMINHMRLPEKISVSILLLRVQTLWNLVYRLLLPSLHMYMYVSPLLLL